MYDWMHSSIEQAISVFQEFSLDWKFAFNHGAREEEIDECEQELNLILPHSYQEFLLRHNGAHLFCRESGNRSDSCSWWADSGIVVFGTKALLEYKQWTDSTYSQSDDQENQVPLPFAYLGYIGTGDFCAFNTDKLDGSEYAVLDCDHDYTPAEWKNTPIAASFEEWLINIFDRIIIHKSLPEYWFSDTLYDNSLETAYRFPTNY